MKKKKNNKSLYIITIVVVSLVFWWIVYSNQIKTFLWIWIVDTNENPGQIVDEKEKLEITIIDDARCTWCWTQKLLSQLKQVPFLKDSIFTIRDFSNDGIKEMMIWNELKNIPAVILSNNNVDKDLKDTLITLKDWRFLVNTGVKFNPFFAKENLEEIKNDSYIKWNIDAKITWLEYSDLECPYCARLHNSDVESALKQKYWNDINIIFNHFPLDFHKNAIPAAQILECVWEEKGSEWFYSLLQKSFWAEDSKKSFLIDEAVKL